MDDWRLIVGIVWGGGTVLVYGRVLWIRLWANSIRNDRRSQRDLLAGIALFLTACAAGLAVALVLNDDEVDPSIGFVMAVALGALLAAGIVMATTERPER